MNFQTMDYFIAVAEERSFTRAAARLSVTQQTLSAHIAGVERELGVRLLERRVPLSLTHAGEVFLGYARRFQGERRTMGREFMDIAGDQRGLLGVGIASTRGHMLMPEAVSRFQELRPGIDVRLVEAENQELVELLRQGAVDLVVATVDADEPGLVVRELRRERVVLLVSEGLLRQLLGGGWEAVAREVERTGSLAALADCPFMLLGRGDEPGDLSRRILGRSGVPPRPRVESKNSETFVELAARGVGACFVPDDLARSALAAHPGSDLRAIGLGEGAGISVSLAWRESRHVWGVIESFADLLEEQVSAAKG